MVVWINKFSKNKQAGLQVSSLKNFQSFSSCQSIFRPVILVCRLLGILLIIIAMARPQTKNEEQRAEGEGVDIVLCIDVSGSMTAQDFTPNRMEAAKAVAASFIEKRLTDRIGVVIFSGESFTQCPLTTDKAVLKSAIETIRNGLLEDGTAIGDGLSTGIDRLRNSKSKSKVVILLTDGENNGGLILHSKYNDNDIINLLYKNNIHGILHLSLFEETYCYALTNSINSGIPILHNNYGSFKNRLDNREERFKIYNDENDIFDFYDYIINKSGIEKINKWVSKDLQPSKWYIENY
jgi:hypothetical protein